MTLRDQLQTSLGSSVTIEHELGGGGMSRVFVAVDTTLQRRIVIKVLPPDLAAEISIARFQREIALVARFQHPHIVPLLAAGQADGLPYYTMPFVEGESLRTRLARTGEMPVNEATRLLREIASALAYAHEKGVAHRDIKPENVLVTGGIALVTDFGVAKALAVATRAEQTGLTSAGIALGTPAYMAPEQAAADPTTDHRADLYAFGVVAYEMLTGQAPFAGRTVQALVAAHLTESPESIARRRPAVPAPLTALVMRCLEKRPADRPQQASEIVQALDAITTPARVGAAPRVIPKIPSRAMLIALALLLAGAAGGAWLWSNRGGAQVATASSSRLLIPPFDNLTGDPRFDHIGRIVADRLVQNAVELGSADVVPSSTVLMALRDTTGGLDQRLRTLSINLKATQLVTGTVVLKGDSLVFDAQLIDPRSGTIISGLGRASGPGADPYAAIDSLGDRLLGAIGVRQIPIVPKTFRAPKLAAAQAFAEGFDRFAVKGDFVASRPYFQRAIEIDPTYTLAYQLLARQYFFAREYDSASAMVDRMERVPQGLTTTERLRLGFMKAELGGSFDEMLSAQRKVADADPGSPLSFGLLAGVASAMLRTDIALDASKRGLSAQLAANTTPVSGFTELAITLGGAEMNHQAGWHDRENDVLRRLRPERPDVDIDLAGGQLRAFAGGKRPAEALALADTMLSRGASNPAGRAAALVTTGALEFRAHGDAATAQRLLTLARGWYASHPSRQTVPTRTLGEGIAMLASGMPDSAAARFEAVARDTTVRDTLSLAAAGYLGLARVARGDRDAARTIADSLGALQRKWLFGANLFWKAAIVGALGDKAQAVDLLQQAHSTGQRKEQWHYIAALDSLHGYPAFDELVRPRR